MDCKYYIQISLIGGLLFLFMIKLASQENDQIPLLNNSCILPKDVSNMEGYWQELIIHKFNKYKEVYPELYKYIWNDEIEKAFLALFEDIKKNNITEYNNIVHDISENTKIFEQFSSESGLEFIIANNKFLATYENADTVNYTKWGKYRRKVFDNYLFKKELKIKLNSNNIKVALINKVPEIIFSDEVSYFKISYDKNTRKKALIMKLLSKINNIGGRDKTRSYMDEYTFISNAYYKDQIFLILINGLPSYIIYPTFENYKIYLLRIILIGKPPTAEFDFLIDYCLEVTMDVELYELMKTITNKVMKNK